MWQVLLAAAAAAGSGILAKKFINPNSDFDQNVQLCNQNESPIPQDSKFLLEDAFRENISQGKREAITDDGEMFRFSSPQTGSRDLRKKTGLKKNGGSKRGKKSVGGGGGSKELVEDQRGNGSGRRISVCLKKRRTGKHVAGKCDSRAPKDSSFGWGVGVGMMYMMSAGKSEISRLNFAMDETTKIVQELKTEISKRKSSSNVHTSVAGNEAKANKKHIEEGECLGTVLGEEQRPEVLEMDQLEAELESELQKLPWCATASSGSEGRPDVFEAEILVKEDKSEAYQNSNLYQQDGVLPDELDKKLCHLLIEQQENQIVELETELLQAHSKLHEKEAELEALKNCVKKLSEFSLASASDEEIEDKQEDVKTRDATDENLRFVPINSIVGMKRPMGFE